TDTRCPGCRASFAPCARYRSWGFRRGSSRGELCRGHEKTAARIANRAVLDDRRRSGLAGGLGALAVGITGAAQFAAGAVATPGAAVFATVIDDLQMQVAPGFLRKQLLQVALGLGHAAAVAQPPALRQAVDVGVHGKRRMTESLG